MPDKLLRALARGRAAWPKLHVTAESFARHSARTTHRSPLSTDLAAAEDFYLACACADRVPGALTAFEAEYGDTIRRAVARALDSPSRREEAAQLVREVLFVGGSGKKAKIVQYAGKGPLKSWVAVVAVRVAVSLGRSETAARKLRHTASTEAAGIDPELLLMKSQLRHEFEQAITASFERLDEREQLVWRLFLLSGKSCTSIGKIFEVDQSTVSRWLAAARDKLTRDLRAHFAGRTDVQRNDLACMARLVESQVEISLCRLLGREGR